MTFSHQIEPNQPLCPFEAAGGTCNDAQCAGQHFRDMSLSDDLVLAQMGSTNPGQTLAEKERWVAGLRKVLGELQEQKTKDADVVATAISNYLRDYYADPTRLVSVE